MGKQSKKNKIYGYARISTKKQNIQRQIDQLIENGVEERDIIKDCSKGSNFNRDGYKALKNTLLEEGDTLLITSVDRLGRNKKATQREYNALVKKGVNIGFIENPELNSDVCNKKDLALESYMAQKELEKIKKRQRQGIDSMPVNSDGKKYSAKTGNLMGRPPVEYPENFIEEYELYKSGQISAKEAQEKLGLKKNSFYKLVHQYEEES